METPAPPAPPPVPGATLRWFYAQGGQRAGPVDDETVLRLIASGQVHQATLMWREGMTTWMPAVSVPDFAPTLAMVAVGGPHAGSGISTLVPVRNVPALVAYYCGIFGLIPLLGAPLALTALVLGIVGLHRAARLPTPAGRTHAWVGIVLGALVCIATAVVAALAIAGVFR